MTRVAYLVSQYPKLSHSFVGREIDSLRDLGLDVETFTIRPPDTEQLLTDFDRSEAAGTRVILASARTPLVVSHLRLLVTAPGEWVRGLLAALRRPVVGVRARIWQVAYFVEAVHLLVMMRRDRLRHVHVHLANNGADVAMSATIMSAAGNRPITWSLAMHGPTEFANVERHHLQAKIESATVVACISDFCRSQLMSLVDPSHWAKLRIVRMGIDVDRFAGLAGRREDRTGPLRILFVGRLVPEKAPGLLIDAVSTLPSGSATVRIVGDGPERDRLSRQIERLGRTEEITLVGPLGQDDLAEQYAWADVFCLPSFAEGVPVVLMEAMASELPVVTTPVGGITELVDFGQTGILVAPGRAEVLSAAFAELADDPARRDALGRAARAAVIARYTTRANADDLRLLLSPLA